MAATRYTSSSCCARAAAKGSETAGASSAGVEMPAAVVAALEDELRHLPTAARLMLEGAAVAGEPFEPELAAQAAGLAPERALELLDELVGWDFVRPEPVPRRFRFRQPIVRRAVSDSIPPGRRLAAHGRIAEALGELGAPATVRAHHLALSARPGDEAAIEALCAAASQVANTAPASAATWLSVALSLLPADRAERRLAVLAPLAQAQAAAGSLADARDTLVEITALLPPGSGAAWSQAVATLASVELHLGRHSGARTRLQTALAALSDPSSPDAIPLLIALLIDASHRGDHQLAQDAGRRALHSALAAGDPVLRTAARASLGAALATAGEIDAAKRYLSEAAAELDVLNDEQVATRLEAPWALAVGERFLERFPDSARHAERGISIALAFRNAQFIARTRAGLVYILTHLGRLDEALRVADEAIETARLLRVPAVLALALSVAASAWSAVDAREALRLGEEALGVLRDVDDSLISDGVHGEFGCGCADAGDHERCIEQMTLGGAPRFERLDPTRRSLFGEALVHSMLALGRVEEARELATDVAHFADAVGLPVGKAAAHRARARVLLADGNARSAAELGLGAADAASARGFALEACRSRIVAGRALAAAGNRDRAIEELCAARTEMSRCGARRIEQEAAREIRTLGAAAPAPVARRHGDTGTTRLSRREREIANLVAEGKSNPAIAAALYLSPKTVEGHMRHIFQKLNVTSRTQVAARIAAEQSDTQ